MIKGYNEHAANERTFLAWVRTGLAVIGFGFVVEKLNLFIVELSTSATYRSTHLSSSSELTRAFARYDGFALMFLGVVLILVQTVRFTRIQRKLDDTPFRTGADMRSELIFSAILVLLIVAFATFLAFA